MSDHNISKAQPSKAKGLGGVLTIRSKNAALLYMYRFTFACLHLKCKARYYISDFLCILVANFPIFVLQV